MDGKVISLDEISEGSRERKNYGDLSELVASLKSSISQIQSVAVVETPEGPLPFLLLAGGRRFRAMKEAGITRVLARIYPPDLSEEERLTIELMENLARKDLEWYEKNALVERIHKIQVALKGERTSPSDETGWSQAKTAELLGCSTATVSRSLAVSKALKSLPALKDCKNQREAEKVMLKAQEKLLLAEVVRRQEAAGTLSSEAEWYVIGDSLNEMSKLESASFDLIDLDPDYAIGLSTQRNYKAAGHSVKTDYVETTAQVFPEFMHRLLLESFRLLKPDGWLILWFAQDPWRTFLSKDIPAVGFIGFRDIPNIWVKHKDNVLGHGANPSEQLVLSYEPFYALRKTKDAKIKAQGHQNVFYYTRPQSSERTHPCEKPLELMEDILKTFCDPGARVLVPFAGSGNTLRAAKRLSMTALGFDLSETYRNEYIRRSS